MKLYGCSVTMVTTGKPTKEFVNWYSTDKTEAAAQIQIAKEIPPPRNTVVEFTPIESDVILKTRGRYKLDDGKSVMLNYQSGIYMHGYRIVNGTAKLNQPVAFFLNGEPYENLTRGKAAPVKELLVPYIG